MSGQISTELQRLVMTKNRFEQDTCYGEYSDLWVDFTAVGTFFLKELRNCLVNAREIFALPRGSVEDIYG